MDNSTESIKQPRGSAWRYLWHSKDIRRKILITLGLVVVYRFLQNIPLPGINPEVIRTTIPSGSGLQTIASLISMLSGGSLLSFSVLALGLYPYYIASVILNLLIPIIPALQKRMQDDQREGRRWMERWTYYLAVPMAILTSYNFIKFLNSEGKLFVSEGSEIFPNFLITFTAIATLTAGSLFAVWIGEIISEYGIRGQGYAILLLSGIIGGLAQEIGSVLNGSEMTERIVLYVVFFLFAIVGVVYLEQGRRNVPIVYSQKSAIFFTMQRGKSVRMPQPILPLMLSLGKEGLIGSQLLLSFVAFCAFLVSRIGLSWLTVGALWVMNIFEQKSILFGPVIFLSVVAATYFLSNLEFAQQNYGNNLKRSGAQIVDVLPGLETEQYLSEINRRITFAPALILGFLTIAPWIFNMVFDTELSLLDGGKIIIVVGVIRDIFMNIEAELKLHGYQEKLLIG